MFQDLLESRAKRQRGGWGTFASAVLHGGVVALAVFATMSDVRAEKPEDKELITDIFFPPPPHPPAPPALPPESHGPSVPGPVAPLPPIPNVTEIPTTIPPIGVEIDQRAVEEWNRSGPRSPTDVVGTTGGPGVSVAISDRPYDAQTVDKAVVSVGDNPLPRYPEMLRQASVQGTVLAQFVVDTLGRVDMRTFRVLSSDHDLFSDAVRQNLPRMRFLPAQVRDRKVSQLVQMPFAFTVAGK